MVSERHVCEWCGRSLKGSKVTAKYCPSKVRPCRAQAWRHRKAVATKLKSYGMTPDEESDVKRIEKVSTTASDFVKKCFAVCGKEIGAESLDAIWDIIVKAGGFESVGVS